MQYDPAHFEQAVARVEEVLERIEGGMVIPFSLIDGIRASTVVHQKLREHVLKEGYIVGIGGYIYRGKKNVPIKKRVRL